MLYRHLDARRGFTLIELLTVIAVIGLLASVLLVTVNGARQDAKDANVLSTLRSVHPAMTRCMNKGYVLFANYAHRDSINNEHSYPSDTSTSPNKDTLVLCGLPSSCQMSGGNGCTGGSVIVGGKPEIGYWPVLDGTGWSWGGRFGSDVTRGQFSYWAYRTISTGKHLTICCTQNGCTEPTELTDAQLTMRNTSDGSVSTNLRQATFCRVRAGFTGDALYRPTEWGR